MGNLLEQVMNIVFNSPQMYIIDYPANNAVEIFDKRSWRLGLIRGPLAERFRRELDIFIDDGADEDKFDDLMEAYDVLLIPQGAMH